MLIFAYINKRIHPDLKRRGESFVNAGNNSAAIHFTYALFFGYFGILAKKSC